MLIEAVLASTHNLCFEQKEKEKRTQLNNIFDMHS